MKILCIIPSLKRGGAERVMSLLSIEWARQHHVSVAVFDASDIAYSFGGELINLASPSKLSLLGKVHMVVKRTMCLRRVIREAQPDVIISFMESANFPSILAALLTGSLDRLTVSVRNDPAHFALAQKMAMAILYQFPSRVVAVSKGVAIALKSLWIPNIKLAVIPNPVADFSSLGARSSDLPARSKHPFILAVGRLHRQKGFDMLIRAFAQLELPDLNLVILGEGVERIALEGLAEQLGVRDRIFMPGTSRDLGPWYRSALCFVLSSRHEGWPNVLMEAMANGCPAVSFDCPYGPSEIIQNEEQGILAEAENINALTLAISKVLSDPSLRARLMKSGLERAGQFGASSIATVWLTCNQ